MFKTSSLILFTDGIAASFPSSLSMPSLTEYPLLIISQGPMNPKAAPLTLFINLSHYITLLYLSTYLLDFISLSRISPINTIPSQDEDSAANTVLCPTWAAQCRLLQFTWKQ